MKIDCISEDEIDLLVDRFYAKVHIDPVLGPIFERVLRDRWGPHLETMRNFWSSVMLTSGRYKGAPVPAHLRTKGIDPEMFDRWLRLFGRRAMSYLRTTSPSRFARRPSASPRA